MERPGEGEGHEGGRTRVGGSKGGRVSARNGGRELNGGGFPAGGSSRRDGGKGGRQGRTRETRRERKKERERVGGSERERPQPIV